MKKEYLYCAIIGMCFNAIAVFNGYGIFTLEYWVISIIGSVIGASVVFLLKEVGIIK